MFEGKGFWFNQIILQQFVNYKYYLHCIVYHQKRKKKDILRFIKMTFLWIPLVVLQGIEIMTAPIWMIHECLK